MKDLAHVARTEDDDDYVPPIPEHVLAFRRAINEFKRSVMNSLESSGKDNQDADKLNDAVDRIIHFGNLLKYLITPSDAKEDAVLSYKDRGQAQKTMDTLASVHGFLEKNGVKPDELDYEDRQLCAYYIETDIFIHTYDLSLAHTNSVNNR